MPSLLGLSLLWILLSGASWPAVLAIGWIGHACKLECPKWIKGAFWKGCSAYLVQEDERCLCNEKCKDANKKAGTVQRRLAGSLAGRQAGWLLSTGYPLDLEARPAVGAAAILRI